MPSPGPSGVYELRSHPECFTPYNGKRRAETVFVVGLGEEGERMFAVKDREQAVAYAKETKLFLHRLHSTQLCKAAVAELFGE